MEKRTFNKNVVSKLKEKRTYNKDANKKEKPAKKRFKKKEV